MDTSQGWQRALAMLNLQRGDRVVMSQDFHSTVAASGLCLLDGVHSEIVPNNSNGVVDTSALVKLDFERVRMIAVSHCAKSRGTVNPVQSIADVAAKHRIPFFLDASQSIGQIPLNMQHLKVCFSFSAS